MDPVVEDAAGAIRDLEIHRLHYTYSMVDLGTFREDYRYVFRNQGIRRHSVVPLLWRWREVQANMYVLNHADSNLVYLPSGITRDATGLHIGMLLNAGTRETKVLEPQELVSLKALLRNALDFESTGESRTMAYKAITSVAESRGASEELNRAKTLTAFLSEFYLPMALLPEPVAPGGFAFVRHGVDLYVPARKRASPSWWHLRARPFSNRNLLWFLLRGRLDFRVPLAFDALRVSEAKSFHCRITIPTGLRVVRPPQLLPETVFTDGSPMNLASYDDGNVYLYIGKKEMGTIAERREQEGHRRRGDVRETQDGLFRLREHFPKLKLPGSLAETWKNVFRRQLEEARKVRLEVQVPLGLARGMASLIWVLWFLAISTVVTSAYGVLTLDRFLTLLGLLLLVGLSIGIFAADKRILREFVSAHMLAAVAVTAEAYLFASLR